jgi:hypothetical protein
MSLNCGVKSRLDTMFNQEEMTRINQFIEGRDLLTVEERMKLAGVKWWNRERGTVVNGANFHPVRRLVEQADANQRGRR